MKRPLDFWFGVALALANVAIVAIYYDDRQWLASGACFALGMAVCKLWHYEAIEG